MSVQLPIYIYPTNCKPGGLIWGSQLQFVIVAAGLTGHKFTVEYCASFFPRSSSLRELTVEALLIPTLCSTLQYLVRSLEGFRHRSCDSSNHHGVRYFAAQYANLPFFPLWRACPELFSQSEARHQHLLVGNSIANHRYTYILF